MNYLIFGTDSRYEILRSLMLQTEHTEAEPADLLILGPKESFYNHQEAVRPGALIYGGLDDPVLLQKKGFQKLSFSDHYRKLNSRATAEGALAIAISETDLCLFDANVLVLGFGFLGRETAALFQNAGAPVTVCSKEPRELNKAFEAGFSVLALSDLTDLPYTIILNTIPHGVLSHSVLATAPDNSILIELASIPCCKCAAKTIRTIDARGLPGRFSPVSAASCLFHDITEQIERNSPSWTHYPAKT